MKIFDVLKNDYFRLFVKRESRVVLGRNYSTLWLLTAVLTVTFLAIAFSNASLKYLAYKMDDPFINWVDIKNDYSNINKESLERLDVALRLPENMEKYHFRSFQFDHYIASMFYTESFEDLYFAKMRFYEQMNTELVDAILSEDNIINGWTIGCAKDIHEYSIGVIVTSELLTKLGYEQAPSYIYSQRVSRDSVRKLGVLVEGDSYSELGCFSPVAIPVLAVVRRLPGGVDIIADSYLYEQMETDDKPFVLGRHVDRYAKDLRYFVPSNIDFEDFCSSVRDIVKRYTDAELLIDNREFYLPEIRPFRNGDFVVIRSYDSDFDNSILGYIGQDISAMYKGKDVHRLFDYRFGEKKLPDASFISIHFKDLGELSAFERYINSEFNIKIEMSQINTKQNFNAVSTMGNILSWVIITFAIIAIILFVVNLLQSYFQKVKRNLGTFKAFGISNRDLISVYVLILAVIIISAVILSISITWFIQGGLHVCGILKDGMFDYISLWSIKTVCAMAIIIITSIYTVGVVMHKLLKATPGDLIYDRQ